MDYPYAKFGDFIVLAVLVLSCGQIERITHTQTHNTKPMQNSARESHDSRIS